MGWAPTRLNPARLPARLNPAHLPTRLNPARLRNRWIIPAMGRKTDDSRSLGY